MPQMSKVFSVEEATAAMTQVRRHAATFIALRADLTELATAIATGEPSALGGMPERKGVEALMAEELAWFSAEGIEVKGWAPLLVDFPARLGAHDVLLCWLEGEPELGWYHRREHGFPGRRPLPR
jgi:hypothetical protein